MAEKPKATAAVEDTRFWDVVEDSLIDLPNDEAVAAFEVGSHKNLIELMHDMAGEQVAALGCGEVWGRLIRQAVRVGRALHG